MLFYRPQDLGLRRVLTSELVDELPISDTKLATAVQHLDQAGFAEVLDDGTVRASRDGVGLMPTDETPDAVEQERELRERERATKEREPHERGPDERADDPYHEDARKPAT